MKLKYISVYMNFIIVTNIVFMMTEILEQYMNVKIYWHLPNW